MMRHLDTLAKGLIGTITPLLGAVASWQEHMESWLRICSLLIGIAVGVASLISIIRQQFRK